MVLAELLHRVHRLDVLTAFLILGFVATILDWVLLRDACARPLLGGTEQFAHLFRPHLAYGRWAVPTSALTWVPANLPYVMLPIFGGLQASAQLRVIFTLAMPMIQTNYAFGQMLLPVFARHRSAPDFRRHVRLALAGIVGLSLGFWMVLAIAGQSILSWLYAGRYTEVGPYLILIGAFPVLNGVVAVQQGILRAHERPRLVFWAYAVASLTAVFAGFPLVYLLGLGGAVGAVLISYTALAIVLGWNLR